MLTPTLATHIFRDREMLKFEGSLGKFGGVHDLLYLCKRKY